MNLLKVFFNPLWLARNVFTLYAGGGGGQNTIEKNADPWVGQQPFLRQIFSEAQQQYQQPGPFFFPQSTVAPVPQATQQAQQQLTQAAGSAQNIAGQSADALSFNLNNARDVNQNPYLQTAIQAAINPVIQNATDVGGMMYNIGDQALGAGQWGGTRQGVAEGIAASRLNQQVGDIAASMANRGYETGLDASGRALALAPQTQMAQAAGPQMLDAVGQQQRQFQQETIDDKIARWNFEQNKDAQKLSNFQQFVMGQYGGSSSGTSPSTRMNPLMAAGGGALAGAAVGAEIGVGYGGWGAGIGAALGLLAAYM